MGNNIKFYYENYINEDTNFTFTSAPTANASLLYDNERRSKLISSGSNDSTPEVWEFEFDVDIAIDTIWIDNHNIKAGDIKYWTGSAWADFSTSVLFSGNTEETNYFEFNLVETKKIRLTMNTTQIADMEKFVGEFRILQKIAELNTNPATVIPRFFIHKTIHQTSKGGNSLVEYGRKFRVKLKFSDANEADIQSLELITFLGSPFLILLCGGVGIYSELGFRLEDMYLVNWSNDFVPLLKQDQLLEIGNIIEADLWQV